MFLSIKTLVFDLCPILNIECFDLVDFIEFFTKLGVLLVGFMILVLVHVES